MESEGSLPYSQEPTTGSCPEPEREMILHGKIEKAEQEIDMTYFSLLFTRNFPVVI
jgi:hypothetical protein